MGQGAADILIWNPGLVTGTPGKETIPGTFSFSCAAQRATSHIVTQGEITSRAEELAGPDTVPGGGVANGYTPCVYAAPTTGIYSIAMIGPAGTAANGDGGVSADIALTAAGDYNAAQGSSIAAWDVTVRDSLTDPATTQTGRVFSYVLSLFTGNNGLPVELDHLRGHHRWLPVQGRQPRHGSGRLGAVREPAGIHRPGRHHAALPRRAREQHGQPRPAHLGGRRCHLRSAQLSHLLHTAGQCHADGARHPAHTDRFGGQQRQLHRDGARQHDAVPERRDLSVHVQCGRRIPDRDQPRRRELRSDRSAEPGAQRSEGRRHAGRHVGRQGQRGQLLPHQRPGHQLPIQDRRSRR